VDNVWAVQGLLLASSRPKALYRSNIGVLDRVPFTASKSIDLMTVKARHRDRYLHNTQQTQETNIHDLSRIRTSDTSNQAAAGLRLKPHRHQHRHTAVSLLQLLDNSDSFLVFRKSFN